MPPVNAEENDTTEEYITAEPSREIPVSDGTKEETPQEEPTITYASAINNSVDPTPLSEEPVVEPEKQTYASIVCYSSTSNVSLRTVSCEANFPCLSFELRDNLGILPDLVHHL